MTALLSRIKSSLGFGGGSASQDTDDLIDEPTGHDTRTHQTRSLRSRDSHDRETHAQYAGGAGKRGRGDGDQEAESMRKRMRSSRSVSHLEANYNQHPGAHVISVNQPAEEVIPPSNTSARMPSRLRGGTHLPMNTLNDQRYASRTGNEISRKRATGPNTVIGRLSDPQLKTIQIRGDNVRTPTRFMPDGFRDHPELHSKKQKLSNGSANHMASNKHIDLTEDDSQQDCFGNVMGRSTNGNARLDGASAASPPFEGVARKLDQFTRIQPEKKKRKSMDSQGSSQNSNRATPNDTLNSLPWIRNAAKPIPADLIRNDDSEGEVQLVSTSTRARPESARSVADLTNGDRNRQRSTKRSGSEEQLDAVGNLMNSEMIRKADKKRKTVRQMPTQQEANAMQRSSLHHSQGKLVPKISARPEEREDRRMSEEFVRDEPDEAPPPRPKARQKMQAFSQFPTRVSLGSEDELTGEKTVMSHTSRSVSPQKTHTAGPDQGRSQQRSTLQRGPSPSNIIPTKFHSSGKSNPKTQSRTKQAEHSDHADEGVDADRIPVSCILCRSCCLQGENIELVWDTESSGYFVELDGARQMVPNRSQAVCISGTEAQLWVEAERKALLYVQIKTSLSHNSNGNVVIEFKDYDGLSLCFAALLQASKEKLSPKAEPERRMRAIIQRIGLEIQADYKKESRPKPEPVAHEQLEIAGMQYRRSRRTIPQDEEIVYELDDQRTRQPTRSRMQPAASDAVDTTDTKSPYFKWQPNPTSRRSSRQSKLMREKSPSPPPPVRWTRENKLERWSHSVVYPPEGTARRVTVDFQDLERLDEGEFLNDNIISFALRRIEENMEPEHKEKVLFFNSFFYTALTTKGGKKAFNYDAVKRWTKSKDLFSFPYVVVPINIDLHWFVAIICNLPNLSRKVVDQESDTSDNDEMLLDSLGEINYNTATLDDQTPAKGTRKLIRDLSLTDNDTKPETDHEKQEVTHEKRHEPSSSRPSTAGSKKAKGKVPPRQRTFDPETPGIITLDSFGSSHSIEIRTLKDYLNAEAQGKRGMEVLKEDLQGVTAKGIPEQTNFCDCGVYVVGYIEEFAKDPQKFVTKVLQKELDKQADFASFNPSTKRAEIRDELLKLHKEQDAERRAKKIAKKSTAESSEAGRSGDPAVASKAQTDNEPTISQAPHSTAFVPLPPTSVKPPEAAKSAKQVANSDNGDDENEGIELSVPRALEEHLQRLPGIGDAASVSSHTLITRNEEEAAMDEINHANSNFDQSRSDAAVDDPAIDLLSSAQECLDSEQDATQQQPTHLTDFREDEQDHIVFNTTRKATGARDRHAARKREVIDLSDENEPSVEIQDSQESQRLSVRNKIA